MKRDRNLRDLSSDHHQALTLVRSIFKAHKTNTNNQQIIDQVRFEFKNKLSPHFIIEEQVILPELEKAGEIVLVNKTLDDHIHLRYLISHLNEPDALIEFAESLKAHIRFEEKVLFEVCQDILDETTLTAIGESSKSLTKNYPGI